MVEVTDGWTPDERESFCTLLTRFNTALSARQSAHTGGPAAESPATTAPAPAAPSGTASPAGEPGDGPAEEPSESAQTS